MRAHYQRQHQHSQQDGLLKTRYRLGSRAEAQRWRACSPSCDCSRAEARARRLRRRVLKDTEETEQPVHDYAFSLLRLLHTSREIRIPTS